MSASRDPSGLPGFIAGIVDQALADIRQIVERDHRRGGELLAETLLVDHVVGLAQDRVGASAADTILGRAMLTALNRRGHKATAADAIHRLARAASIAAGPQRPSRFRIIEAQAGHCDEIVQALRAEHREAMERSGLDLHCELRCHFDDSAWRCAWTIDGRLAAIGGVTGMALASHGTAWLAVTQAATRHRFALAREARRQLAEIMVTRHAVAATVVDGDTAARRFAAFLGFVQTDSGIPFGQSLADVMLRRAER